MLTFKHHALIIGTLATAAIGGTVWYLASDDVAQVDIKDMYGLKPQIDARIEKFPTINIAKIVGWQGDAKPVPAEGLQVNAFAADLDHPRWMHVLPNGDVLVAESTQPAREAQDAQDWIARKLITQANGSKVSANRITLLRDADGDGKAEFRSVLLTAENGLNSPFGMQLLGDKLYIANTDALLSFPFKPGETQIKGKGEKITALPATLPNNHWTRNLITAEDGKSLFIAVGSNSNIGENGMESEENRAAILIVDPAKKKLEQYAIGLRNPVGMALEPVTKSLWVTVNERDMLGSDGPPDYLTDVDFGSIHGWPWFYYRRHDSRTQPRPDLQDYVAYPQYALGPHTASLGLTFADKAKLGPGFARGAFIGQHGSWNRSPASGYKVLFVPFTDKGRPDYTAKPVDVLNGFLNKEGDAQGRPAGVVIDGAGALLVADDSGNRIWRVSAKADSMVR